MLKRIAPQKAQDDELGYTVQSAGRYHVEYIESQRSVRIEVDRGLSIGIYKDSLTNWEGGAELTSEEKAVVLSRVEMALQFMGSKTELC